MILRALLQAAAVIMPAQSEPASLMPRDPTPISVPSGQIVTLEDVIWNAPGPEGLTLRFRFLAPAISRSIGSVGFEAAVTDMQHLCTTYALTRVPELGPMPAQIIISLSDIPVPFGQSMPEATQFFEAFRIENGACIWEVF